MYMGLFDDILNGAELPNEDSEKIKKESPKKKSKAEKKEEIKADGGGGLPSGFIDILESIINDYCLKYNIESPQKMSGSQWRSACYCVGEYIKQNKIIIDKERTAREGGVRYNADVVNDIIDIFGYMCGNYKKSPLVSDFACFCGVSLSWVYDANGVCQLTSARGNCLKRLKDLQEAGVASGIVNDSTIQTGKMFFSKCVLGWSESGSIRPQTDQADTKSNNLPDFNNLSLPKL